MPIAYVDPDTQEISAYPGEEEFLDAGFEQEATSQASQQPQQTQQRPITSALGFEPPPDGPMPGIRARKSRGRKAGMRAIGADG